MPLARRYFNAVDAGAGDLCVLRRQHAGDADGADDLAVHHDRQAAFERHDILQRQKAQAGAAAGDGVVQHLGRPLEHQCGLRLALRDLDRGQLHVVVTMQHDDMAAAVDDGDDDRPVVLGGFGFRPRP